MVDGHNLLEVLFFFFQLPLQRLALLAMRGSVLLLPLGVGLRRWLAFLEGLLFLAEEIAVFSFVGFFVGPVDALGAVVAGKAVVLLGLRHLLKIDSKKKGINAKAIKKTGQYANNHI